MRINLTLLKQDIRNATTTFSVTAGAVAATLAIGGTITQLTALRLALAGPWGLVIAVSLVGLGAVVFIFRFRSFREVLHAGRASREAEREAERAGAY